MEGRLEKLRARDTLHPPDFEALRALLPDYQERGRALEAARGFVFDATLDDRYPDHAADVLNQIDATLKGKSHD